MDLESQYHGHLGIEAGCRELVQRAEKISDADWRHSFLENAVENKTIVERWQKICEADLSPA